MYILIDNIIYIVCFLQMDYENVNADRPLGITCLPISDLVCSLKKVIVKKL